jgi:hypothetical protein
MKIELNLIKKGAVEDFAKEYGLTMQVDEMREPIYSNRLFRAKFKNGNGCHYGSTPDEAITNYLDSINMGKLIIIREDGLEQKIDVWRFESICNAEIEKAIKRRMNEEKSTP